MSFHLLITRPQLQIEKTAQAFQAEGVTSQALPMLEVQTLDDETTAEFVLAKHQLENFSNPQHVIFISANAVDSSMRVLKKCSLDVSYFDQPQVWAIGDATAQALKAQGIDSRVAKGSRNSEALLAESDLQNMDGQQVLIFRGQGGRKHLAQVLGERGAQVQYCESYRRAPTQPKKGMLQAFFEQAEQSQRQPVLLIMSVETLQALEIYAEQEGCLSQCQNTLCLVPGERVAARLKQSGFERLAVSCVASIPALVQCLMDYQFSATKQT